MVSKVIKKSDTAIVPPSNIRALYAYSRKPYLNVKTMLFLTFIYKDTVWDMKNGAQLTNTLATLQT